MGWSRVNSSRARAHLQEAVALLEALAGHDPANADLQAERAQAAAQLGRRKRADARRRALSRIRASQA